MFVAGLLLACTTFEQADGGMVDGTDSAATAGGVGVDCTPGDELACTCANGASGTQLCLDDGHSVGGCMCAPQPDPTAASTTLPNNADGNDDDDDDGTGDSSSGSAGESGATQGDGSSTAGDGSGTNGTDGDGTGDRGTEG